MRKWPVSSIILERPYMSPHAEKGDFDVFERLERSLNPKKQVRKVIELQGTHKDTASGLCSVLQLSSRAMLISHTGPHAH